MLTLGGPAAGPISSVSWEVDEGGYYYLFMPRKLWTQKALRPAQSHSRTEWLSLGPQSLTADTHPPSHPRLTCLHTHVEIRGPKYSRYGWKRATLLPGMQGPELEL